MKTCKVFSALLLLYTGFSALGQESISSILLAIEANNPTLQMLQAHLEFEKVEARADNFFENPTVEYGRFPSVGGTGLKTVYGVSQGFDFPTAYAKRKSLANQTTKSAELAYRLARRDILLEAKQLIIEKAVVTKMLSEAQKRLKLAKTIEQIFERKVAAGMVGILDLNNARMRTAEASQKQSEMDARLRVLNYKLLAMNGMKPIDGNGVLFSISFPSKDSLLIAYKQKDLRFSLAQAQVDMARANLAVVRHEALPKFEIGFESEQANDEHFRGIKAGVTIPLWADMGKKRAARARYTAANAAYTDANFQLTAEFEHKFMATESLNERYRASVLAIDGYQNIDLLKKAVEMGEISIVDFYTEVSFLYEFTDHSLELELELAKAIADLLSFEL